MIKSLAAFAMALSLSSCAVGAIDGETEATESDLVSASHAALSGSSMPAGAVRLYARATLDPALGTVMVDVATSPLANIGNTPIGNPHTDDQFQVVMVYIDRADGRRDVLRVLGKNQIGPGGGCIHFNVVAKLGDRLFIGGVVKLAGTKGAKVGIAPTTTVVHSGDWQGDPTTNLHSAK